MGPLRISFGSSSAHATRATLVGWALLCLAIGFVAELFGVFDLLELKTYDVRVARRPRSDDVNSPPLVRVTIDDRTETLLGPFPWANSHDVYLSLVEALAEAGARGAFFVLYFNREQPNATPWDRVTIPVYVIQRYATVLREARTEPPWVGGAVPVPAEIAAAQPIASFSTIAPSPEDGVRRFSQIVVRYGFRGDPRYSIEARLAADVRGTSPERLDVPLNVQGRLLLSRRSNDLPTVSFADVLAADETIRDRLRGRWALIGTVPRTELDSIQTPFGPQSALDLRASVVETLLTGDAIHPRSWQTTGAVFLGWAVLLTFFGVWIERRLPSFWVIAGFGGLFVLGHLAVATGLFFAANRWIPIVAPSLVLIATTLVWTLAVDAKRLRVAERRLLQAEREAAFGIMSAQVRHEIRNLLNSIRSPAEMVQRNFARGDPLGLADRPEELVAEMNVILERVARLSEMVENELSFFDPRTFHAEEHDLWEVVLEAKSLLASELEAAGVIVHTNAPEERTPVPLDPVKMRIVFVNLIRNAMQAMPEGGILSLCYDEPALRKRERFVRVRVEDTGVGMKPEQRARLFDPFYTTKARGLGLGLLNVKHIIEAHGGRIRVESESGHGSTFEVLLPCPDGTRGRTGR